MGFNLYFIKTVTGEVGSPIDPLTMSWGIALNKSDSISATVPKEKILKTSPEWYSPWSGGLLVTYTAQDGQERPLVAGPITDWGSETPQGLALEASGIRKIFEKRMIAQNLSFTGISLGDIAWGIVDHVLGIKPGGGLPIYHKSRSEKDDRQRTYERWNLANNQVDKRLTEISEVIGGPDIMFRPEWVDNSHRLIRWGMVHGTSRSPFIPQDWTPDFDTTAAASDVADVSVTSAGKQITVRYWYTGAGEGDGIARTYVEDLSLLDRRSLPFLEDIESDSDQPDVSKLREKAAGALAASKEMLDQVTLKVRADSSKNPLGAYFVGDEASVTLKDWISIPDGTRMMRLIKMSGSDSQEVTIDFQEDTW